MLRPSDGEKLNRWSDAKNYRSFPLLNAFTVYARLRPTQICLCIYQRDESSLATKLHSELSSMNELSVANTLRKLKIRPFPRFLKRSQE